VLEISVSEFSVITLLPVGVQHSTCLYGCVCLWAHCKKTASKFLVHGVYCPIFWHCCDALLFLWFIWMALSLQWPGMGDTRKICVEIASAGCSTGTESDVCDYLVFIFSRYLLVY